MQAATALTCISPTSASRLLPAQSGSRSAPPRRSPGNASRPTRGWAAGSQTDATWTTIPSRHHVNVNEGLWKTNHGVGPKFTLPEYTSGRPRTHSRDDDEMAVLLQPLQRLPSAWDGGDAVRKVGGVEEGVHALVGLSLAAIPNLHGAMRRGREMLLCLSLSLWKRHNLCAPS